MNIQQMMKQAQALQSKMGELQAKLGLEVVVGAAGGGLVKVHATCKGELQKIEIDPSLLSVDEKEVLEDLIVAAFKNAKENADARMNDGMKEMASSLGLPPNMLNFPF
jgi:DNA-binding YbaB/EbfC family protein